MSHAHDNHSDGLASKLWNLANFVRGEVVEAKRQNKLVETSETFVRPKFRKYEYNEHGGSKEWQDEYFVKTEWHWKHQREFIQNSIVKASEYEQCAITLKKQFGTKSGRANHGLSEFVQRVSSASIGGLSDQGLVELVAKFVNDLNDGPTHTLVSIWADGFWLKQDRIVLGELVLRRPTIGDLQVERSLHMAIHSTTDLFGSPFSASAIVDFSLRAKSGIEAQEEVMRLMGTLRLFRLGSVQELKCSVSPESILRPSFSSGRSQNTHATYRYGLSAEDQEPLELFISRVKPLLKTGFDQNEAGQQPADLAFARYSDAVLIGGRLEARITAAITCLEALFLKGEERSELSHKLSLRIASLLRLLGFNPLEVQGHIHRAYDIRSTHIHGGQVDKERLKDGSDLCQKVLEYARLSAVVFLQLKGKLRRMSLSASLTERC